MVLSDYERQQIEKISAWKGEAPGRVSRALARVRRPLGRIGASLVPDAALRKALDSLDAALDADGQVAKFLVESGVATVDDLKRGPLEECDRLAEHCGVRAERLALGMGAVAGAGGVVTELAGIPLLLTAALRAIHRTGLCYGYRVAASADRPYLFGVLELSTVGDPGRRRQIREHLARMAGNREVAGEPPIGLEGIERGVAGDLALEVVPLVGDPVAIVLDYTMMKRVDRTARMVFQERWLRDAGRIEGEIVPAPPHPRDDALRNLHDLAGQAVYLAGYGVGFGVTLPAAAVGRASRWLPGTMTRGVRDGARDAAHSADELRAGWCGTRENRGSLEPVPVTGG